MPSMKVIDVFERMRSVTVEPYNSDWPIFFEEEASKIRDILGKNCLEIYHIGSTSIPGIYAKPILDIMPIVKDLESVDNLNPLFESLGYMCMDEYGIPGRRFYWKSKTKRTHNVHLFEKGNIASINHLFFKEYMNQNPEVAKAYSLLKQQLASKFPNDIESYVNGKAPFILDILSKRK